MNRLYRLFFCAAVLACAPLVVSAATPAPGPLDALKWRQIGPAVSGGRVAAVAGTASDPNLYYLGAAGGGVWKSENGGETWTPVFEKQSVAAIGAVTIDPTDENVVWVGTGETNPRNDVSYGDGVYKTTDGGKTWTNMGLKATRHIGRILIDPKNPAHVVVAALGDVFADSHDRGVYVTNDGGKTWAQTLYVGPQSGASELAMDPNDPRVIYASVWQFRREPWTFHSGGPDDGIWKSIDGGATWSRLAGGGLPAGIMGRSAVAIAPSNSKRIYAIIEAKGGILWRSDDAGTTWTMVSDDTLVDQRPFYFTHLNVDPSNADHVYAVSEMLAESKDGGKKFKEIADAIHVDYHAVWIAPNDPKRMIVGEDGGYATTRDGGKNWSFSRNLAIGQVYHVGLSVGENPYWVCAPLQDNNGFCAPSNSRDRSGIKDDDWLRVVGGDGMWAVPDPSDPRHIMTDLQTGRIFDYDKKTMSGRQVVPYFDFSRSDFTLFSRKYRFNWDSPIAFAPWNPHLLWLGGSVVFQSPDRGLHWTPISPDLTLNIKEHQQPSGGPLALDVSSAEFSDAILDIEGSPVRAGTIWVGTDDGLVQVTRDGGKHWRRVEPKDVGPFGRIETVAPSNFDAATAYASVDRHRSGDYAPYLFVTHNYGASWAKIVTGLPADQYVRTVRADTHNRNLLYAGTEQGIWVSQDAGATWNSLQLNLPTVSVRDIRIQPEFGDLAIATHGRALWILDDIAPLQGLTRAQGQGSMLFPIRTAYQYITHSNDEGLYTRYAGQNPPTGAIISFYQTAPQAVAPEVDILNAGGHVIRHIKPQPQHTPSEDANARGAAGPGVTNVAGVNRVVWNFREDGVPQWMGAARAEYRGPLIGVGVAPGTYAARIVLHGHTYTQSFKVAADPQSPYKQTDFDAAYRVAKKYLLISGQINVTLNHLDDQKKALVAAQKTATADVATTIGAALAEHDAIFSLFTADYHNDEDSIQRPGGLREDLPGGFGAAAAPTQAQLEFDARYDAEYATAVARYNAYVVKYLTPLKASGVNLTW
ncbi:MAG: glycosyl hydrolase [Candidatus Eremiobacteraeota bacterium]|nr:glycosyl hydrolase [Candidatus Eremiobacteraeota bacterium]